MITVAGQRFIEYEKELDNWNQIFKSDEDCFSDSKVKTGIVDKNSGDKVKDICSEKDEIYKKKLFQKVCYNFKK